METVVCGTRRVIFAFLFLLGMGTSLAFAQLPTATVLGTVKDSSAAVMPEVILTARHMDTGLTRTDKSGADGSYRFAALPVGVYEIRAEQMGFLTSVRSRVALAVGQEAVVNFSLQVGAITQTVEVTGEAPLVNTTSGSLGGLVAAQQVEDLPLNGRNYAELTLLQPGITQHRNAAGFSPRGGGTWFSANGAPPRSNSYMLDGALIGNAWGATTASVGSTTLGVEGIREWRMVTNSSSAEYGMRMGSQMTIVTKGGTNDFHGALFEYLRNSTLDARNFFDYQTQITPFRLPPFRRNQFGGAVGGPIQRDKLFYFATYEGLQQRLGLSTVLNVIPPSAKVDGGLVPQIAPAIKPLLALFPDPNLQPGNRYTYASTEGVNENYGQARGDYIFSTNDTAFLRYTIDRGERKGPLPYPQFRRIAENRFQFITASDTHTFSPALLGTFRFSFSRTFTGYDSFSGLSGPQYSFVPGKEMGELVIAGITTIGPDRQSPSNNNLDLYSWGGDLFYTKGRHCLKFGTLINYAQNFALASTTGRGGVNFANLAAFLQGQTVSYNAITPGSNNRRDYNFKTLGFYLQDDLRAMSNLTLNLGLRYEVNTNITEVNGRGSAIRDIRRDATVTLGLPFENPSLRNFSPRFGFAWDVRGDGKTAVRGGFALVYDVADYGPVLQLTSVGSPPFASQSTVSTPGTFSIPLFFPPSAVGRSARTQDYHMQNPHMLHYNFAVERQLPANMSFSLAYAGSRGFNLLNSSEGNPTQPQVVNDHLFWPVGARRLNPNWDAVSYHRASANSWYNSLQFVANKRLSQGVQFQSSYTWSKLLDEGVGSSSDDGGGGRATTALPRSIDRGLANWSVAHVWRLNAIYRPPAMPWPGFLGKVLNGWWTSGILSAQTGLPFTPTISSDRSRSLSSATVANAPELNPGRKNANILLGGPDRYFDPLAFSIPPAGFMGSSGRNILIAPGVANLDFSLVKDTALGFLGESGKLEFRTEVFNLLNRPNFARPSTDVYAARADVEQPLPTAGQISKTDTASRQIQFALKLIW